MTLRMLVLVACAAALPACGGSVSVGSQDAGGSGGHSNSGSGNGSSSGGGGSGGVNVGGGTAPSGSAGPVPTPSSSGSAGTGGPVPNGGTGSVCYGDATGCQCEASFQGHDEVLVCAAISGRCTCLLDGVVTQSYVAGVFGDGGTTVCTNLSGIEAMFTSACGFKR